MKTECRKCSAIIEESDDFCRKCGSHQNQSGFIDIDTGDNSINIGVGNLPNSNFHFGDKYETKDNESIAYIDRTYVRGIKIGNSFLKQSWVMICGGIGFLGSIASIFAYFSYYPDFSSVPTHLFNLAAFFIILWACGFALYKIGRIRFGSINIETDKGGRLYFTKVGGKCPKCGSPTGLSTRVIDGRKTELVSCERNPQQHFWGFDFTVLSDISEIPETENPKLI